MTVNQEVIDKVIEVLHENKNNIVTQELYGWERMIARHLEEAGVLKDQDKLDDEYDHGCKNGYDVGQQNYNEGL